MALSESSLSQRRGPLLPWPFFFSDLPFSCLFVQLPRMSAYSAPLGSCGQLRSLMGAISVAVGDCHVLRRGDVHWMSMRRTHRASHTS